LGKKFKKGREIRGKFKIKSKKGGRKERNGEEQEKMGSKRVKQMQNREESRQRGDRSRKTMCCKRRKIISSKGRENI
jgi:hypothetical protein